MRGGWLGQLKPARTAGYTEFLARLLCIDVSRRYGAEEALNDPWIRDSDWAESDVAEMLAALDDSKLGCADPLPKSALALAVSRWRVARDLAANADLAEVVGLSIADPSAYKSEEEWMAAIEGMIAEPGVEASAGGEEDEEEGF